MHSSLKLEAFDYALPPFLEQIKINHLFSKKRKRKILFKNKRSSCTSFQTRDIWPCLIHFPKKKKKIIIIIFSKKNQSRFPKIMHLFLN